MNTPPESKRILIVKLSSLGDLFHALPAVRHLKNGLGASVDWVTQPEYVELVGCFTDVDLVIAYPRRSFCSGFFKLRRALRVHRYDYVFDFQGLLKSALVARMARADRRIGPSFHREGAHWFYDAVAGPKDKDRHAVEEIMDVVSHLGLPRTDLEFPVAFPERIVEAGPPRIGFVPSSRWAAKNWAPERFIELGQKLQDELNASLILIGGATEKPICDRIEAACKRTTENHCGQTSLIEMGGLIQELDVLVTVDSGPMHVAAALEIPVVAIFGPTDPKRTGPYGKEHRVLQSKDLQHEPDLARAFKKKDWAGSWDVPVEDVHQAVMELLVG